VVTVRRHSLPADLLDGSWTAVRKGIRDWESDKLTRSDDFTGQDVDLQPALVKVLNVKSTSSQRGQKVDLSLVVQVVTLTLKAGVGLLLNHEHDVSRNDIRTLVTLTVEGDLLSVLHSLVDGDVENLALVDGLLAIALLATVLVLNNLALSVTVGTHGLESLDHGSHLAHHRLHTGTVTSGTLSDGTLLSTASITLVAKNRLLEGELGNLSLVKVLKGDLVNVDNVSALSTAG
jgi:hypothetical protein